jgi:hypothetical protein
VLRSRQFALKLIESGERGDYLDKALTDRRDEDGDHWVIEQPADSTSASPITSAEDNTK